MDDPDPRMADPEYAKKWLKGEWIYMNETEQEELLLIYGTRKQRKALKERQKAHEQAKKQSK